MPDGPLKQAISNGKFFNTVALPTFIAGNALDGWSTLKATQGGYGHEANPFMGAGGAKNVAMKAGINALVGYLLKKYQPEHPKLASGLALGLGLGMGAIGAHNMALTHRK